MYYHYTSTAGAEGIKKKGVIHKSHANGVFGPGVYLTDLEPEKFFRYQILKNNYGGNYKQYKNRADWVVKVYEHCDINMNKLKRVNVKGEPNRRIFVYPDEIEVSGWQIIDKPRCELADDDNDDIEDHKNGCIIA